MNLNSLFKGLGKNKWLWLVLIVFIMYFVYRMNFRVVEGARGSNCGKRTSSALCQRYSECKWVPVTNSAGRTFNKCVAR